MPNLGEAMGEKVGSGDMDGEDGSEGARALERLGVRFHVLGLADYRERGGRGGNTWVR